VVVSWQARFNTTSFTAQLAARQPVRGLVASDLSGKPQLYAWERESDTLRPITNAPGGVSFGGISPDGRFIYYYDGLRWVRVPFDATPDTPREALGQDLPPYDTTSLSMSLDGSRLGFTVNVPQGVREYVMLVVSLAADGTLGDRHTLYRSRSLSFGPMFSFDGRYAVVVTTERSDAREYALIAFDLTQPDAEPRILQDVAASIRALDFAPVDGSALLLGSTDSEGVARPLVWDLATGDRIDLPLGDMPGDVRPLAWYPDGITLLLVHTYRARQSFYRYDLDRATFTALDHPTGTYRATSILPTGHILTHWQDAEHAERVIVLDGKTGTRKRTIFAPESTPPGRAWRSVEFPSSGGVSVQAWLCTPPGNGPFPLVVYAHGGPTDALTESYDPVAQAWVDAGYAWLGVNYRGSATFGEEFQVAIMGMLGHREVDDLAAGATWAVEAGIADETRVIVSGAGYGGFLALQAAGKRPAMWSAVVAESAITDWRVFYTLADSNLRAYHRALWGGTPDDMPEVHRTGSPISYVDAVEAPVLLIQPLDDPRLPTGSDEAYIDAMQAAGRDLTVHRVESQTDDTEIMTIILDWCARS
jgi:dipeptidyl aminopeptidase/acylaminoacyl peptidase